MAAAAQQIMQESTLLPRAWQLLALLFAVFVVLVTRCWYAAVKEEEEEERRRNDGGGGGQGRRPVRRRTIPSPPALPIVGHLHLVGALPHVSLRGLAREYGPDVMLLRLGAVPTLVVSSPRAAEEVLRASDHLLASRPPSIATDVLMYGSSDIGFAPYGERWRQAKKLLTMHMLTARKVRSFRAAAAEEVSTVMDKIREAAAAGAAVDVTELLGMFMVDMACRLVSGDFFRRQGRRKVFRELLDDTSRLLGGFNMEDLFPALARVGMLTRRARARAERVRNGWSDLLDGVIDHHEQSRGSSSRAAAADDVGHNDRDFVHVLLSLKEEYDLSREHMKAILTDVFFGAIDTTSRTLDFTFVELMRKPAVRRRLQAEVRSVIALPEGGSVSEIDLDRMAYLRAVIKESVRLHPVTPLLAPHHAMAECIVDGHVVPRGTRVVVNAWAIGRDPSSWEDPEEFMPERFLDDGGAAARVSFRGNDFEFLTFGSGRRMCPGINLAMSNLEIMLANLMCLFDWQLPIGMDENDIDMTEEFGMTVRRKKSLVLFPKLHV